MTDPRYDLVAIGNAIVDVIARSDDAFLETQQLPKGGMILIDADRAEELYAEMGPGQEISGGSVANSMAGASALGRQCAFVGQLANDQLGEVFAHDIRAAGIDFDVAALETQPPTGRCLIFVTDDAQRTMGTFLGAAQNLSKESIDPQIVADSAILYLEGYLWDPELPRAAMQYAMQIARQNRRKIALTLSDTFCVDRHRDGFIEQIKGGNIDILFANEAEILSLCESEDLQASVKQTAQYVDILVVTQGGDGAMAAQGGEIYKVAAEPVAQVVDTTGAGDLFAAGFLSGYVEGRPIQDCLTIGSMAAAEIISHYGARIMSDLSAHVSARFSADQKV